MQNRFPGGNVPSVYHKEHNSATIKTDKRNTLADKGIGVKSDQKTEGPTFTLKLIHGNTFHEG
jgi:hypothetical protein